ncbi:hypothetical protein F5X96DRAFT_209535 [Biscogniauxia mediterranea]|nr:hypothetical protein F5X96DRAFT_209535 [Biscogniauxia mediterranea]
MAQISLFPDFYTNLKRKDSRWSSRVARTKADKPIRGTGRYNLLLYVKGVQLPDDDYDDDETPKKKLKTGFGTAAAVKDKEWKVTTKDGQDVCKVLCGLVKSSKSISRDYEVSNDGNVASVQLRGNKDAQDLIHEIDELIDLASTVYPNPNDLRNWMKESFERRFLKSVLRRDGTSPVTLDRALQYADNWTEVRYRFMNHYLRDDPYYYQELRQDAPRAAAERANFLTHGSQVEEDCYVAQSTWFSDKDRKLYEYIYRLTITEGCLLREVSRDRSIAAPVRELVMWMIDKINRFHNWRVEITRSMIRRLVENESYRKSGTTVQDNNLKQAEERLKQKLVKIDNLYKMFIEDVKRIMKQVDEYGKVNGTTDKSVRRTLTNLKGEINRFNIKGDPSFTRRNVDESNLWPARIGEPGYKATLANMPSTYQYSGNSLPKPRVKPSK